MIPDDWINVDHTYTKRFKCEEIDKSYVSRQLCLILDLMHRKIFWIKICKRNFQYYILKSSLKMVLLMI